MKKARMQIPATMLIMKMGDICLALSKISSIGLSSYTALTTNSCWTISLILLGAGPSLRVSCLTSWLAGFVEEVVFFPFFIFAKRYEYY
jgi:hypothetical protein